MTAAIAALAALLAGVDGMQALPTGPRVTIDAADHRVTIDTGKDLAAAGVWAQALGLDRPRRHRQPRPFTSGIVARDWLSTGAWHGWHVEVLATVYGDRR